MSVFIVNLFVQMLTDKATCGTFTEKGRNNEKTTFLSNNWFNEEYKNAKIQVNRYAKNHDISIPPFNGLYHQLESDYKN